MTRRFLLPTLVLIAMVGVAVAPARGGSLDSDLDRVRENIAFVRGQISTVAAERSQLSREILATADELEAIGLEVEAASDELNAVRTALDLRTADLEAVRTDLGERLATLDEVRSSQDAAQAEAEDWAVRAYMGGGPETGRP